MANRGLSEERSREIREFDETKAGLKGVIDSGITKLPEFFKWPEEFISTSDSKPGNSSFCIPVIDLSGISNDSDARRRVAENVGGALEKYGFFQVINHGIPCSVLDETVEGIRRFHEEDAEAKKPFYSRDPNRKVTYNCTHDLFHSGKAFWKDTLYCAMSPNPPHPQELPSVCSDIVNRFSNEVMSLGKSVIELISEALGLERNQLTDMKYSEGLRVLGHYYPACPEPELTMGSVKHTDGTFITVVLQDQIGGLQVLLEDQWVDVPPVKGALVVNAGDLLQLISNDKFISVSHRVLAKKVGPRISVVGFFRPDLPAGSEGILIGPVKQLLSEKNPPVYKETNASEYVKRYLTRRSHGNDSALEYFKL